MDSSNLEETYDDESDVEDSEADDELKDEFEGVLKQVQNDSCHQQTDVRRGNKRSAGNVFKFPQQIQLHTLTLAFTTSTNTVLAFMRCHIAIPRNLNITCRSTWLQTLFLTLVWTIVHTSTFYAASRWS